MKAFIAGATGVLGRRVVRMLISNGHEVVGLSRSSQNRDWLSQHGAVPREGSLFDREQLCHICADCDAVLHLATALPTKMRTTAKDWALNDRIRREGTENLVAAALYQRPKYFLQQSVSFIYGDRNGDWVDETTPLPQKQVDILQSAVDMEQTVHRAESEGLPATILRFGRFYSHDSAHTQAMFRMVRKRLSPVIGSGDFYWNLIDVDDAATAVTKVVDNFDACLNRTFNIGDDEPVLFETYLNFVADTLGAGSPFHIPVWLARLALGASLVDALMASVRYNSEGLKELTGWEPQNPTYRQGIAAEVKKWLAQSASADLPARREQPDSTMRQMEE